MAKKPASDEYERSDSGRTVTSARGQALSDYLGIVAAALGLREWTITLKWDRRPDRDDVTAQVKTTKNRHLVTVLVAESFFDEPPDVQRNAIVHELVHVIEEPIYAAVWNEELSGVMGRGAAALYLEAVNDATERVTDRLAGLLEALVPLPAFPPGAPAQPAEVAPID